MNSMWSDLDIDPAAFAAQPVVGEIERRAHKLRRLVLPLLVLIDDFIRHSVLRLHTRRLLALTGLIALPISDNPMDMIRCPPSRPFRNRLNPVDIKLA